MPKRHFILYCDESDKKGAHYSNFYGGALVDSNEREGIEKLLHTEKARLNLHKEIKWQYITENYKQKYIDFMNLYFDLVENNRVKVRVMFTHNQFIPRQLTDEHVDNEYFILYYYFIMHAFGFQYGNSQLLDTIFVSLYLDQIPHSANKIEEFKNFIVGMNSKKQFVDARVRINRADISNVDSRDHVLLQGLDIILGAMNFRLNERHKEKPKGSRRRGRRTIAKEQVYKYLNERIQRIYPRFNIGVSTAAVPTSCRWTHPYRHWCFEPSAKEKNKNFVAKNPKKRKAPPAPT
jgi:hypothetical protein